MVDKHTHSHHISQQFNAELDDVKTRMLEMGGMVEQQVQDSVLAFMNMDSGLAESIIRGDREVNNLEVSIDEECTLILARRQPAASDLRLVIAISKTLIDLERMGDEATKVAEHALAQSEYGDMPRSHQEIRHIGDHVVHMLHQALDAFARLDSELALKVAQEDKAVDREYATAMRSLVTYMIEDARNITGVLNVMWSLRSLERIGDHARNIAEHVIYLVEGKDVRHVGLKEMEAQVKD